MADESIRRRLPDERTGITHRFSVSGHKGYINVGMYEDGAPGEVFIVMAKTGSTISGLMDCFSIAISMGLQYGVPLEAFARKFVGQRFEPQGFTTNSEIKEATSVMDYIFQWLAAKFDIDLDEGPL